MTTLIKPFRALRPAAGQAEAVAAPPYDVLNSEEARLRAQDRPDSFLHISKPEIDLPPDTDPYAPEVYNKGSENLQRMIDEKIVVRDDSAHYYVYRLKMGEHIQTGLAMVGNVADYDTNRIRKHEFTRPKKENDRVRQITALNAQTGPVLLAYRNHHSIKAILNEVTITDPVYDLVADDVGHTLWLVTDSKQTAALTEAFDAMDALYIADGHHRSASASRVAAARKADNPEHSGEEMYNYFLCVAFPDNEMQIFDYNRVICDLAGLSPEGFVARIRERFTVTPSETAYRPKRPAQFGMYLEGYWYQLNINRDLIPSDDPVARLDISLLQDHLVAPFLGIKDQRTDDRIDFVGGIRGLDELSRRVDSGEMAVAFSLFPTSMEDLMAIADANEVMPPKSTWFEPKLADGLLSHVLD